VIIAVLYGASDEIHQYFVPGRVCDIFDLVADSIGGFIGAFFTKKIK
jgi:VanZ family protein